MLGGKASESVAQTPGMWLRPNARQAEAAMHRLRELHLPQTPAATELSQSLTVLVLVADMLVQGQLAFVHPEYRGRGIGRVLLQWLEARQAEIARTRPAFT